MGSSPDFYIAEMTPAPQFVKNLLPQPRTDDAMTAYRQWLAIVSRAVGFARLLAEAPPRFFPRRALTIALP